jgi:hypothetical protein
MLLGTLLQDFGLRLCAQRDVVQQLLLAVANQLERMDGKNGDEKDRFTIRPQLITVLSTVNQFSPETFQQAMTEVELNQRKLLLSALRDAPDPRLVALGAAAAEQAAMQQPGGSPGVAAGSAAGALRRTRSKVSLAEGSDSPTQEQPPVPSLTRNGDSESQPTLRRTRTNGPLAPLEGSKDRSGFMEMPPSIHSLQRTASNKKKAEDRSEPVSGASTRSNLDGQKESPRFGDSWGKGSQGRPLGLYAPFGEGSPASDLWNSAQPGLSSPLRAGNKLHRVSSEGSLVRREDSSLSVSRLDASRRVAR